MGETTGNCRICGREESLSFEHVPPRSSYHRHRAELFGLEHWLQRDEPGPKRRGTIQQRGVGSVSLCKQCNNTTGSWYVPELQEWTRAMADIIANQALPLEEHDRIPEQLGVRIRLTNVYPLRFAKQMVTMLLAISNEGFATDHPDLVRFVRERRSTGLLTRYRLYIALYRGPIVRVIGGATRLDVVTGQHDVLLELAYPPCSYVLALDVQNPLLPAGDVTHFADVGYDEQSDVELDVILGCGHTPYPCDYRTKAGVAAEPEGPPDGR